MTVTRSKTQGITLLVLVLVAETLFFIPAMRFLDWLFPGSHEGFDLIGVWFYWLVPGVVVLGAATLLIHRRIADRGEAARATLLRRAWAVDAALVVAAALRYRLS